MKKEIKNKILKEINNKSCMKYPKIISKNKEYISYLNELYPSIKNINEKLYLLKNNLSEQDIICEKGNKRRFISFNKGYGVGCSKNCSCMKNYISEKIKNKDIHWKRNRYERIKENNLKKYGVKSTLLLQDVKEKIKNTNLEKYGVDNPIKNEEIKKKRDMTNTMRYGNKNLFCSDLIKNKIQENKKKTLKEKYNREHNSQIHISKDILNIINNRDWLFENHHRDKKTIREIAKDVGVSETTIKRKLIENNIKIITHNRSLEEKEIEQYIRSFDLEVHCSVRNLIYPYELDIYIPQKKIAFEYCGLYWHCHQRLGDKNYHLKKLLLCKEKNIKIVFVFSNEWIYRKEKTKRLIEIIINEKEDQIFKNKPKILKIDRRYFEHYEPKDYRLVNILKPQKKYFDISKNKIINKSKGFYIYDCGYKIYELIDHE